MLDPYLGIVPLHFVEFPLQSYTLPITSRRQELLQRSSVTTLEPLPARSKIKLFIDFEVPESVRDKFRTQWKTAEHDITWSSGEWIRASLKDWRTWETTFGTALRALIVQEVFGLTRKNINEWGNEKADRDAITFETIPAHLQFRLRYWNGSAKRFQLHCDNVLSLKQYLYEQRQHKNDNILHPVLRFPLSKETLDSIDSYTLLRSDRDELTAWQQKSDQETLKRKAASEKEDCDEAKKLQGKEVEDVLQRLHFHARRLPPMQVDKPFDFTKMSENENESKPKTKTQRQEKKRMLQYVQDESYIPEPIHQYELQHALRASLKEHENEQIRMLTQAPKKEQKEQKETKETNAFPSQEDFEDECMLACFESAQLMMKHQVPAQQQQQQQQAITKQQEWGFAQDAVDDLWET
jgi:hypothetical protein